MRTWLTALTALLTIALVGCKPAHRASDAYPTYRAPAPAPARAPAGGELATTDRGAPPRAEPEPSDYGDDYDRAYEDEARSGAMTAESTRRREARRDRPGLGTEYGERRRSETYSTRFRRGHSSPDTTLALRYDDLEGVRAVARGHGWRDSTVRSEDGAVSFSIVDAGGRPLDALDAVDHRYAVGEPGQRYQLLLTNHTSVRFEVVASVDGLDVIDGERASVTHRGYILDPFDELVIDGWRTSEEDVAAFRFGRVRDSYASRRGDGRNVGVVGVAFFHEAGSRRRLDHRREHARPFDDRFAPPPPPRW